MKKKLKMKIFFFPINLIFLGIKIKNEFINGETEITKENNSVSISCSDRYLIKWHIMIYLQELMTSTKISPFIFKGIQFPRLSISECLRL